MEPKIDKVLIIINRHAFTYEIVKDTEFDSIAPYKGKNNIMFRILREIHFRLNLPKKSLWYIKPDKDYDTFLIYSDLITPDYIDWLHCLYPHTRIIITFENICTPGNNPANFYQNYIHFCSGDQDDCKKYNMQLLPPCGSYTKKWIVKKRHPLYDLFFIGKDKKNCTRLKEIEKLEVELGKIGISLNAHIVPYTRFDWYKSKRYKKYIPYSQVLEKLAYTRAILYLGFGSQKCVTIRVQESLLHKIKLVTDSIWIKEYDFYHPDNIFILGEDKLDDLPAFLAKPYVDVQSEFFNMAYYEDSVSIMLNNKS